MAAAFRFVIVGGDGFIYMLCFCTYCFIALIFFTSALRIHSIRNFLFVLCLLASYIFSRLIICNPADENSGNPEYCERKYSNMFIAIIIAFSKLNWIKFVMYAHKAYAKHWLTLH